MPRTRSPKSKTENSGTLNAGAATAAQETFETSVVAESPRPEPKRRAQPKTDTVLMPSTIEEEIRRRAYELYEGRGFTGGHETEDWLVAEQEVLQRYRHHSA